MQHCFRNNHRNLCLTVVYRRIRTTLIVQSSQAVFIHQKLISVLAGVTWPDISRRIVWVWRRVRVSKHMYWRTTSAFITHTHIVSTKLVIVAKKQLVVSKTKIQAFASVTRARTSFQATEPPAHASQALLLTTEQAGVTPRDLTQVKQVETMFGTVETMQSLVRVLV